MLSRWARAAASISADGARFEEIEAAARAHRLNTLHAYLAHQN